jgi:hypothetical protein
MLMMKFPQVHALPDEADDDVKASSADLRNTLDWMRLNYDFVPPQQPSHREFLTIDEHKACRIYTKKVETFTYVGRRDEYPITYVLDLETLDPTDVIVSNSEMYPAYATVKVRSTNGLYTIRGVGWPTGESREKEYNFTINDNHMAERFAKALRHAITLCGGNRQSSDYVLRGEGEDLYFKTGKSSPDEAKAHITRRERITSDSKPTTCALPARDRQNMHQVE